MIENSTAVEQVTQLVIRQLKQLQDDPYLVPVGISARHIHLTRADVDALFGPGYRLTPIKKLSQPGQFACEETVEVIGPAGKPLKMRVLGPERKRTQVEVSFSDSRVLGLVPPVRTSGDTDGTPGVLIKGPKGEVRSKDGVIIADRHIHMTPEDAAWFGVRDGQRVTVEIGGEKGGTMDNVVIRVTKTSRLDFHIDTDDANAFLLAQGQTVRVRVGR